MKTDESRILDLEKDLDEYFIRGKKIEEKPTEEKVKRKKEEKEQEEVDIKKEIFSTLIYVVAAFVFTFLFIHYVGERTLVEGSSMESTISDRDQLFVDKLGYRFHEPERFDVVVFPYRQDPDMKFIKRVIGLPGETIQIDYAGNIYIDGAVLQEDYGLETIADPGRAVDPITLGANEYFVMGDNRNNSKDSRYSSVGNITDEEIIGKARFRIFPFNKLGRIDK